MSGDLFREIVGRHSHDTPEDMADALCVDLGLSVRQREALWRLIYAEVKVMMRAEVRSVEQAVGRKISNAPDAYYRAVGKRTNPTEDRRRLLRETFSLGDGRRVAWGAATVDDHLARIRMMTALANGIQATIDRHRAAVDAITEAGVSCLDDLENENDSTNEEAA